MKLWNWLKGMFQYPKKLISFFIWEEAFLKNRFFKSQFLHKNSAMFGTIKIVILYGFLFVLILLFWNISFKLIQNHNAGMKDKSATDNISTKIM